MKNFIITTDATCDLSQAFIIEHQIGIMPIPYLMEGITYGEASKKELPIETFYEELKAGKRVTTSATSLGIIRKEMLKYIEAGNNILHISFSSALSSSHNNACITAKELMAKYPGVTITVVDSLSATLGQGLLVQYAVQMKQQGKTMEEIAQWINDVKKNLTHQFTVADLFHLSRGGRISKSVAVVGTALNVRPILNINNDGELKLVTRVRRKKRVLNTLLTNMEDNLLPEYSDYVCVAHGDCLEDAQYLAKEIKEKLGVKNILIAPIGPAIGAHTGPNTIAVMYFGKER